MRVRREGLQAETESIRGNDPADRGRKLRHDIRHEIATIQLLASIVAVATDVGPASRVRVQQLIDETQWLDQLVRSLDDLGEEVPGRTLPPVPERLRVDVVVGEVVDAFRLAAMVPVTLHALRCEAYVDRLALWRALRNLLDNACRAAGSTGRVAVGVSRIDGWSIIQVDDDGAGFDSTPRRVGALGLDIVQDLVSGYGGRLETGRGELGGGCVRILLPRRPTPSAYRNYPAMERGNGRATAHL